MYLVYDVGGTYTKYALMNADGGIITTDKFPTKCNPGDTLEDFVASIGYVYDSLDNKEEIDGIAMGIPGMVDVETGIVYNGGSLRYLDKVNVAKLISERCGNLRVSLENDGKCAALAEVWKGHAIECSNACVLVFGTGIGGGVIVDRKVHHGSRMAAGEFSWAIFNMTRADMDKVLPEDQIQTNDYIFENLSFLGTTQCSTASLVKRVAKLKGLPKEEVSGELIYEWAEAGDKDCIEILEDLYFDIAKLCMNAYVTLDPDVILIGGGISAQPAYIEGIRKYVNKMKEMSSIYAGIKLDVCKYHNRSNLLGALYNYMQKYESDRV